jgi:hypothetical protein
VQPTWGGSLARARPGRHTPPDLSQSAEPASLISAADGLQASGGALARLRAISAIDAHIENWYIVHTVPNANQQRSHATCPAP